jgi:hypothetical protein
MWSGGIATPFLPSEPDEEEWSASRSCSFAAKGKDPESHCIGGGVRPTASLDIMENRKIFLPCRE